MFSTTRTQTIFSRCGELMQTGITLQLNLRLKYLDTTVYKGERFHNQGILDQYTHLSSCNPHGVRKGLAKGEALRLLRTNSSAKSFSMRTSTTLKNAFALEVTLTIGPVFHSLIPQETIVWSRPTAELEMNMICPHLLTFAAQKKSLLYEFLLRLIRVFVQIAHTTRTNTKSVVCDVSATEDISMREPYQLY